MAAKNKSWENHIQKLDDGNASKFWKFLILMMNECKEFTCGPLTNQDGVMISDPNEKNNNMFLEKFSPIQEDSDRTSRTAGNYSKQDPLNMEFRLQELNRSLMYLSGKSDGP